MNQVSTTDDRLNASAALLDQESEVLPPCPALKLEGNGEGAIKHANAGGFTRRDKPKDTESYFDARFDQLFAQSKAV